MSFPSEQNRDLCLNFDLHSYEKAGNRFQFWSRSLVLAVIAFLLSLVLSRYLAHHPWHNHAHAGRNLFLLSTVFLLFTATSTRNARKDLHSLWEKS